MQASYLRLIPQMAGHPPIKNRFEISRNTMQRTQQ